MGKRNGYTPLFALSPLTQVIMAMATFQPWRSLFGEQGSTNLVQDPSDISKSNWSIPYICNGTKGLNPPRKGHNDNIDTSCTSFHQPSPLLIIRCIFWERTIYHAPSPRRLNSSPPLCEWFSKFYWLNVQGHILLIGSGPYPGLHFLRAKLRWEILEGGLDEKSWLQ